MSENRDDELDMDAASDVPVSPEGRVAEDAVRALPTPVAAEAFRGRVREAFIAGSAAPSAGDAAGPAARGSASQRRAWPSRRRTLAVAIAVAATILAVVLLRPGGTPADEWTIAGIAGADAGSIRIDGREHSIAALRAGGSTIRAGARVELPESTTIELRRAGLLALETAPGSWFALPRSVRSREGVEPLIGTIERGEVRYVTGPGFVGHSLRIESDEAAVEVVGTTFSVIRDTSGTCVCVESGQVRIVAAGGRGGWDVPAGRRRQVFTDARPSLDMPLRPGEAMKLQMFRDRSLPELDRPHP